MLIKGGTEKINLIGAVITALKEKDNCADDNLVFMAPTRKATSSARRSTLHSRKEVLSAPAKNTQEIRRKAGILSNQAQGHGQDFYLFFCIEKLFLNSLSKIHLLTLL